MTFDQEQIMQLSGLVGATVNFLRDMDMEDDSANRFRDELYEYLNSKELDLTLIARNLPDKSGSELSSQVATNLPSSDSLEGCPFHYCDSNPKCENKCRYNRN